MANEIRYAGFWRRLGAHIIDLVVMSPILAVGLLSYNYRTFQYYYFVPSLLFSVFYSVYLVKRYGGTPGKLLTKTKIQKVDGQPVDWRSAILRHLVIFALSLLMSIGSMIAVSQMTDDQFTILGFSEIVLEITKLTPTWAYYVNIVVQVWTWSEFLVIMTNKKRRAIHDFIAGTVVICTDVKKETSA